MARSAIYREIEAREDREIREKLIKAKAKEEKEKKKREEKKGEDSPSATATSSPSKKVEASKEKTLIKANATGDDRNILDHGTKDLHYQYSIGDAMRLLTWIRSNYLESFGVSRVKAEDRGAFFTENTSGILLTEPYHQDNFITSLENDIDKITGTGIFKGKAKWFDAPTTIIIPLLSSGHWRSITIIIDYNEGIGGLYKVNILFDDPYGEVRFPLVLKQVLSEKIEEQVKKLIKFQNVYNKRLIGAEVFLYAEDAILNITIEEREGDQQGWGKNGWDCGPILFSNIEDRVKYAINSEEEMDYSIPIHTDSGHQDILNTIRTRDIERYSETTGIAIGEVKLRQLKQQITKSRIEQLEKINYLGLEEGVADINDWAPLHIDMLFAIMKNKREAEGNKAERDPYTREEINYARQFVLQEIQYKEKLSEEELPSGQKVQAITGQKIQEIGVQVKKIIQSTVSSQEKIEQLKQIEKIEYAPLIKKLAYKKTLEELKDLAILFKNLGYLTKQIGDLSTESYKESILNPDLAGTGLDTNYKVKNIISEYLSETTPLKYYTDVAVLYQYVITIINEKINPERNNELYNEQLKEIYRELATIKRDIISISAASTTAEIMTRKAAIMPNIYEDQFISKEEIAHIREITREAVKQIELKNKQIRLEVTIIKKQQYEDLYIKKTEEVYKEIASNMKNFLAKLYRESEKEIGSPPCLYTIIGLGSMALNQMTPYSDLEFAILTENEDYKQNSDLKISQYFKNLTHLVHFKIINLGETIIPNSKYGLDLSHLVHRAVNFDLGGKTPLGRIERDKPYDLIQTVDKMFRDMCNEDNKTSNRDKTLPYILEKTCFVYGDKSLVIGYQTKVTEFLHSKVIRDSPESLLHCQLRAIKLLKGGVELDDLNPGKPIALIKGNIEAFEPLSKTTGGRLFDVKQEIYRLADRLIHDLGVYYGIEGDSAWQTVEQMHTKQLICAEAAMNLKFIVTFATNLRLKTYLTYKGQIEDIHVIKSDLSNEEMLEKTFHLPLEDIEEKGNLFKFYYTAFSLHKKLGEFCSRYEKLTRVDKNSFFKHDKFYENNDNNKGGIFFRLTQYKKAIFCFEKVLKFLKNNPEEITKQKMSRFGIDPKQEIGFFIDHETYLLGIKPEILIAQKNLAFSYLFDGDYDKSYMLMKQIIDRINFDELREFRDSDILEHITQILNNTAHCLIRKNNNIDAIELFEQAIKISYNPAFVINCSKCYRKLNQPEKAKLLLQKEIAKLIHSPINKFTLLAHYGHLLCELKEDKSLEEVNICISRMKELLSSNDRVFKNENNYVLFQLDPIMLETRLIAQKVLIAKKNLLSIDFSEQQLKVEKLEIKFNNIITGLSLKFKNCDKVWEGYKILMLAFAALTTDKDFDKHKILQKEKVKYYYDKAMEIRSFIPEIELQDILSQQLSEKDKLIESIIIPKFNKLKTIEDSNKVIIKISVLEISQVDLINYCKSHLGINSSSLEFRDVICLISLNKNSINILRNKVLSQNFDGQGAREYEETSYWNQYSKEGIKVLLKLRLENIKISGIEMITPDYVWNNSMAILEELTMDINSSLKLQDSVLVCLNLYGKHWIGLAINQTSQTINLVYLDSEQKAIPELLKYQIVELLSVIYHDKEIVITEAELELQRSNNCGPEVIENFILYLTGSRLPQNQAVAFHSHLLEEDLLFQAHQATLLGSDFEKF